MTMFGLAASFVPAVWPPSALQLSSSTTKLIGWPAIMFLWSANATFAPRTLSVPSAVSGPEITQ